MDLTERAAVFKQVFDYLLENLHETGYNKKRHPISLKEIYILLAGTVEDRYDSERCPNVPSVADSIEECLKPLSVRETIDMVNTELELMRLPFMIHAKEWILNRKDTKRYFVLRKIENSVYTGDDPEEKRISLEYAGANFLTYMDGWAAIADEWYESNCSTISFYSFSLLYNLAHTPLYNDTAIEVYYPRVEKAKISLEGYYFWKSINRGEVYDADDINYICEKNHLLFRIRCRRNGDGDKFYVCREYIPINTPIGGDY